MKIGLFRFALIGVLIVVVLLAAYYTAYEHYLLGFKLDLTLVSPSNTFDRWDLAKDMLFILFPLLTGLLLGLAGQNRFRRWFAQNGNNGFLSITTFQILWKNKVELVLVTIIVTVVLFVFAGWLTDFSRASQDTLVTALIGFIFTIVSIVITAFGMHYAFLAESKSDQLLQEKADFVEHFSGFINRINSKIGGKGGILSSIDSTKKYEKHFYFIKCMFLTPFLGHAGLTIKDERSFKSFVEFKQNIERLIFSNKCEVKILTLSPEKLVSWYSQIQWIRLANEANEDVKLQGKEVFRRNRNVEVVRAIAMEADEYKFEMSRSKQQVPSFKNLCDYFATAYGGTKQTGSETFRQLEICHTDYIPFQMFLVTEAELKESELFPEKYEFVKTDGRFNEVGRFVAITYVGQETYSALINDILLAQNPSLRNGGIPDLLRRLHAGFISEDPRLCNMLNQHFNHYWEDLPDKERPHRQQHHPHFPRYNDCPWTPLNIEKYIPEGKIICPYPV